jgi:hypothetical protein
LTKRRLAKRGLTKGWPLAHRRLAKGLSSRLSWYLEWLPTRLPRTESLTGGLTGLRSSLRLSLLDSGLRNGDLLSLEREGRRVSARGLL